jgi:hypothetical protein
MSASQVLRAPRELVDEWEGDAEAMASAHVLVREGNRYGFFHEAFFDYVFARRFVSAGGSLAGLLNDINRSSAARRFASSWPTSERATMSATQTSSPS